MTKGEAIATAIATLENIKQFGIDKWMFDKEEIEAFDMAIEALSAMTDDENELKFYYVESIDDYWVGRRLDNFYYADWHDGLGFVWSHSRYLPWGEHIVDENTLWKEHTYPSEPIEIPFTEWVVGFVKKYFAEPKKAEWIPVSERLPSKPFGCIVTVWDSTPTGEGDDFENILPYFVGWDGEQWNDEDGEQCPFEVIAWMPLPEPCREDGEV